MLVRLAKIIAVLIVTALAVVGLVFDLKLQNGGLSDWGKIALALTFISGITAVMLEAWEHRNDKQKEKIDEIIQGERKKISK